MPHNSTHTYIVLLHRFHRPENTPCRSFEPTSVTSIYDPCTSCDQYHILSYPTKQPASTTQRTRLQYHSWSCWVFSSPTDTINRLWDSNSSWMRTAHISHHKLCDMLLPGMYVRVWVCANPSVLIRALMRANLFNFLRLDFHKRFPFLTFFFVFFSMSFSVLLFPFPPFSFRYRHTVLSSRIHYAKWNQQWMCSFVVFFSLFFLFSFDCFSTCDRATVPS